MLLIIGIGKEPKFYLNCYVFLLLQNFVLPDLILRNFSANVRVFFLAKFRVIFFFQNRIPYI